MVGLVCALRLLASHEECHKTISVPIFTAMPNRHNDDLVTDNLIPHDIRTSAKLNNPFAIVRGHVLDEPANFWIAGERPYP